MMKINSLLIILIILSILGTAFVYNRLPEEIPGHINLRGEVDRYDGKETVIFTGLLPLIIYLLMVFLPRIDPKRKSYLKHKKAYEITKTLIIIFIIIIQWAMISLALGFDINIGLFVKIGVGLFFIVLGNFMGQIRHNYFFGIKTPWTLSNETVWKKTHRVGGFSFMIAGVIMFISIFFNGMIAELALIAAIVIAAIYPIIYSYIEFRKITKG